MVTGSPRFNGLAIGEISINYLSNITARKEGDPPVLTVKAAFVNSEKGTTHGWTQGGGKHGGPQWSKAVVQKAEELRELLETELAQLHFDSVGSMADRGDAIEPDDRGLAEHAEGSELFGMQG